ncbi:unnamed protein product [Adineta steineri]|uniref:G-protein coupled receptors family 1 profile domain-containing protein n=1 Tax=Adineta steineri TaxID=433720 RepID=A0A813VU06_9BILA|nr:unnamed protein product [Adineta steineri]CAF0915758.1 unnamed protein product [Adineta steineri]CAF3657708.1 unnamed protein product [Adineta steineri]CAF3974530.1 unnamed protein product [Adineta steineri]
MSNTSSSSSINFAALNQAINRYVPIPFLFLGAIGNIFNILIFTRKVFRNNICVNYLLASTISDSFAIIVGLLPRLLNGFNMDPSQNSTVLCKLRFFITYFSGYAAAWYVSFACIDRYLSSSISIQKRNIMTMKRAYLSLLFVIILGFIAFSEQFYCIDIGQNLFGAPQSCYQLKQNIPCQIVDSLMQFIFEILLPALMMIIFGSLTLKNIHQRRRRVHIQQNANTLATIDALTAENHPLELQQTVQTITNLNRPAIPLKINRTARKRDAQLVTMLVVQVAVFIISAFPISIYKLYSIATIYDSKSVLQKSVENTIYNFCVISLFLNNSMAFYIYTLSGTVFRKELMKLFRLA